MEDKRCEEATKDSLDMKSKSVSVQSAEIVESSHSLSNLAVPTPKKNKEVALPLDEDAADDLPEDVVHENVAGEANEAEDVAGILPDKYKILAEFFDRIGSSVRLLGLSKKMPTFQNICTQVEVFTKRKLSYNHLAQIKYILPEAVQVDKILVHDERTLCMKQDMKITLLLDVVEADPDQSPYAILCQMFHQRMLKFFRNHPEGCDIPEATLPVLMSQSHSTSQYMLPEVARVESYPSSNELEPSSSSSLLSSTFKRRFSEKIIVPETEKTKLLASRYPFSPLEPGDVINQDREGPLQKEGLSQVIETTTPMSLLSSKEYESSPMKSISGPNQLMLVTPTQSDPQRRTVPDSDEKVICQSNISSHSVAKKSLNFLSPLKGDEIASGSMLDESKHYRDSSLKPAAAKRILMVDDVTGPPCPLIQAEFLHLKDKEEMIGGKLSRTVSLPDLFNLIYHIFQSAKYSSITKQELVHKIISEDVLIEETKEAEEQLDLLEELVPDWIQKKLVPSGDLLYSITKVSDLDSIRARLVEAV
ncbi:hypothetical protein C5167_034667 [Papaver somniferum]|uniref:CDT1 Geminin-binding domain-containing protein n=1 Tax=Papaver somniferum TaxID=3469 RepID=A0A4Y7KGI2_PAPSO|nr:CDT1-like protein a, chloroplastic [Papaver somniferum]RZC71492.1 hypothetical protein C5167_034667 [Papaver somniferum]